MISAIKRLEQHLQLLETRYKDRLRKGAFGAPVEITEEMQDQAYASLMAPQPSLSTSFLPAPTPLLPRLPEPIVKRLGTALEVIEKEETPKWAPILQQIQANGGFKDLEISVVNKMVFAMSASQRSRHSDDIISMLKESGVSPNTFTYDLLMMANADIGNVEKVQALFNQLKEAPLIPNVRIYAHLLKAYSHTRDVAAASAAFQEMHELGIKPNLIVYTSLIRTCINREELHTAWQIFDLIKYRSTETAPDVTTFSLMIHACSMRGEAEKALDLFRYMTEIRKLEPDAAAYSALIHACAVRKDYFLDAWKFAIEMRNKGLKVNRRVLNFLLQSCGRSGDLTRARLLLRLMMSSGGDEYQPDELSFQHLFRAYAASKLRLSQSPPPEPLFVGPNPGTDLNHVELNRLPFLQDTRLPSKRAILTEAKQLLRYLMHYRPGFYSTRILNAYMDVCLTQHGYHELRRVFRENFAPVAEQPHDPEDDYPPTDPNEEDELDESPTKEDTAGYDEDNDWSESDVRKPPKNIYTFEIALEYSYKQKALRFARHVWTERMRFCESQAYWDILQPIRKRLDFTAEKLMMETLAKAGALHEALQRLEILQYEYNWKPGDLKVLYDKAREREDMDALRTLRRILRLDERRW
ncbi:hypothetical protein BDZ91DRAFT_800287 [Kalaharituber pfeilii]|nr:hypothetical protein BDZ91DRAFT_800287 [Kalaharituber pfeilii]